MEKRKRVAEGRRVVKPRTRATYLDVLKLLKDEPGISNKKIGIILDCSPDAVTRRMNKIREVAGGNNVIRGILAKHIAASKQKPKTRKNYNDLYELRESTPGLSLEETAKLLDANEQRVRIWDRRLKKEATSVWETHRKALKKNKDIMQCSRTIKVLEETPDLTNKQIASIAGIHEATVARDLELIRAHRKTESRLDELLNLREYLHKIKRGKFSGAPDRRLIVLLEKKPGIPYNDKELEKSKISDKTYYGIQKKAMLWANSWPPTETKKKVRKILEFHTFMYYGGRDLVEIMQMNPNLLHNCISKNGVIHNLYIRLVRRVRKKDVTLRYVEYLIKGLVENIDRYPVAKACIKNYIEKNRARLGRLLYDTILETGLTIREAVSSWDSEPAQIVPMAKGEA